jgi:hypothetical protein
MRRLSQLHSCTVCRLSWWHVDTHTHTCRRLTHIHETLHLPPGFIGPVYGWRLPFVVIAIPSILVIALVMLTMKEPPRAHHHYHTHHQPIATASPVRIQAEEGDDSDDGGEEEEEEDTGPSLARNGCSIQLRKFMDVFVIRTNLLAFCQSLPGCLPWGCVRACVLPPPSVFVSFSLPSSLSFALCLSVCLSVCLSGWTDGWIEKGSDDAAAGWSDDLHPSDSK